MACDRLTHRPRAFCPVPVSSLSTVHSGLRGLQAPAPDTAGKKNSGTVRTISYIPIHRTLPVLMRNQRYFPVLPAASHVVLTPQIPSPHRVLSHSSPYPAGVA